MLRIHESQMALFGRELSPARGKKLLAHLEEHFPDELSILPEGERLTWVTMRIEEAESHLLTGFRDLVRFAALAASVAPSTRSK